MSPNLLQPGLCRGLDETRSSSNVPAANFGAARVFHFLAAIPRFAVTAAADEDPGLAEASLLVARKRPL